MQRILEPEVMDSLAEALEYDQMDFAAVNLAFVQETLELAPRVAKVLDAGTGTARIPILMAQQRPHWTIVGIDLAESMLAIGKSNVQAAALTEKICLERFDAKQMPYEEQSFDLVVSNSLLHHLPDPLPFLQEVKRVLRPTGQLFFRDLLRPDSPAQLEARVAAIGFDYSPHQRQLFRDSLAAAFTLAEIGELLHSAALDGVQVYQSSERHWSAKKNYKLNNCLSARINASHHYGNTLRKSQNDGRRDTQSEYQIFAHVERSPLYHSGVV